jgi:bis(5'-nucleosyl)-tetraphosphatase (symmetrical)
MATYVIGDLQGCYAQLMGLLDKIKLSDSDALWFVGDLVNRGPQSLEVLRFLKNFTGTRYCVLGNHDLHLLAAAQSVRPLSATDTFNDVLVAPDRDELLFWLRQQPFIHYDATLNTVMAHAGIYPFWHLTESIHYAEELHQLLTSDQYEDFIQEMYGNVPAFWDPNLSALPRYRFILNAFTRMRAINADHSLNFNFDGPLSELPAGCSPWFKKLLPEYQSTRIVFGHWAALLGETHTEHVYALDTGCVWGNRLTALRLEDGSIYSVPSAKNP